MQKNRFGIFSNICFRLIIILVLTLSVKQISYADWVKDKHGTRYSNSEGEYLGGFQEINEKKYYFNQDGYLVKGKFFCEENQNYYFADKKGVIQKNVIKKKNAFYIADSEGHLQNGFLEYENNRYYFDGACNLVYGWFKVDDDWYYANDSGVIQTGFLFVDGNRYYLEEDGRRVSNTVLEIDGTTYLFGEDGSIDENATTMYPVYLQLREYGNEKIILNSKVQACAILRASALVDGFQSYLGQEEDLERLLKSRGIKCNGGYEFSYGGTENYDLSTFLSDLKKDWNLLSVLEENESFEVGLGMYEKDSIMYFDIIFIRK